VAFSRATTAEEVEVEDEVDAEGEEEGGDSRNYNKADRAREGDDVFYECTTTIPRMNSAVRHGIRLSAISSPQHTYAIVGSEGQPVHM
jgi:hypothetical protein